MAEPLGGVWTRPLLALIAAEVVSSLGSLMTVSLDDAWLHIIRLAPSSWSCTRVIAGSRSEGGDRRSIR